MGVLDYDSSGVVLVLAIEQADRTEGTNTLRMTNRASIATDYRPFWVLMLICCDVLSRRFLTIAEIFCSMCSRKHFDQ